MCRVTVEKKEHTNDKHGIHCGNNIKTHDTEMKNITIVGNNFNKVTCLCMLVLSYFHIGIVIIRRLSLDGDTHAFSTVEPISQQHTNYCVVVCRFFGTWDL